MESLFSAFGIEWKLLLAQGVNFLILVGGLTYLLYHPVMKMLDERKALIAKGVDDAEAATRVKTEIESERTSRIATAETQANEIVVRAETDGKEKRAEIVHAAQERSEQIVADARAQALELEREALKKSEKEIARVAVLAAEKILKES